MNIAAIFHRSSGNMCFPADENTVVLRLQTGKDIEEAYIICADPFVHELTRRKHWTGQRYPMQRLAELSQHILWEFRIQPPFKRLQYYFEVAAQGEHDFVFDNKICPVKEKERTFCQCFKMPWMNPSDVIIPPEWVKHTVWYQIMPDRFCRSKDAPDDPKFIAWNRHEFFRFNQCYGGNLRGIAERLPYLKKLGINGIYLTPIFYSVSYHKYNTIDYRRIDPDFGTEDDLRELVQQAHKNGIRIMLDGVFNHCGAEFAPWQDVCRKGKDSPYYDWFFINQDDFLSRRYDTADGRYYTFSFWAGMPKLNTNNPEVIRYFENICSYWIREWDIDGIRFDVGDEVSHTFLRALRQYLKPLKEDLFLLGEIWFDSLCWLDGKEYDAVMNYPLSSCINDFHRQSDMTAEELMTALNGCLTMYPEQVTEVLFNFLDTHDTVRIAEECANNASMLRQKLILLLTLPGTPCLYYGTEIALRGKNPYDNRSTMPWQQIEQGKYTAFYEEVRQLIALRREKPQLSGIGVRFHLDKQHPRLVHYTRSVPDVSKSVAVVLNGEKNAIDYIPQGNVLYADRFDGHILQPYGSVIYEI